MSTASFFGMLLAAGTAVLAVGWTGAYFLRRQAAWENALWRTVLVVLLVLPAVLMVGPFITWPSRTEENRYGQVATVVMKDGGFAEARVQAPPAAPMKASNAWPMVWRSLLWIWGTGTVVSLVGLARSAWKVGRWARAAAAVTSEGTHNAGG